VFEPVGVLVAVVALAIAEGVDRAVFELVGVLVAVVAGVAVPVAGTLVSVGIRVSGTLIVTVGRIVPVALAEADGVVATVPVPVAVPVALGVALGVAVPVAVPVALGVAVPAAVAAVVAVDPTLVSVGTTVVRMAPVGVPVGGVAVAEAVPVVVMVAVAAVAVVDGEAAGVGVVALMAPIVVNRSVIGCSRIEPASPMWAPMPKESSIVRSSELWS